MLINDIEKVGAMLGNPIKRLKGGGHQAFPAFLAFSALSVVNSMHSKTQQTQQAQ
jgi:hypothetical protein